jgi:arginine-tRNA-protein transferase
VSEQETQQGRRSAGANDSAPAGVRIKLTTFGEQPCVYLPDQTARMRGAMAETCEPAAYRRLMDANFRRSGRLIYQPVCEHCRACRSLRVPVATFAPSKSQRRVMRRNADLTISIGEAMPSEAGYELYRRYCIDWHGQESIGPEDYLRFLHDSPVPTLEFQYRTRDGYLLAVGICDRVPGALSSVYFYFDPRHADRSLGTFGALCEIDYAAVEKLDYYYLGYWVAGCGSMTYKANFKPCELLGDEGWTPVH